ncbi:MAG TPA: metallophosphoesterase family protein [Phenylobacterium sp.]
MATVWPIDGEQFAVLADCHIHPGGGPAFPTELFDALAGVDLIVTLGDMGESAGLDRLMEIAPVIGVRGQDDAEDPRTGSQLLLLASDELAIGCVFDAVAAGLATSSEPFTPVDDFASAAERVFGRRIDALLHASTHRPETVELDGCLVLNPGSAVLPAEGARRGLLVVAARGRALTSSAVFLD